MLIRGVNRHEHHPLHGQVMDEQTMVQDILLMKQNNFNAVRCSHYPNHPLWTLCDHYGQAWWMKPTLKPTAWCQ
ncbi:glycoside hydrolase family 2 TIM barrel-domain containing protein [Klebsiella pneumoniae]|uniref:glycoside hydrolase family 2 TIM barrel-domain containing protein n=1 Tax=Klebsiella pneumoniae TaxID=573 RepID=UPI0022659584|nr:glycoside hydrolase family 2 TIM barrel-domain containing protein [Klebsiella pneumoniae]